MLGVGFYLWERQATEQVAQQSALESVRPGGNRAARTLADGRVIDLNGSQAGIVMRDGITYLDGTSVLGEQANKLTSEQGGGAEQNIENVCN